ncbi:MAG: alanine racemase [Planctomycetota bacterium]
MRANSSLFIDLAALDRNTTAIRRAIGPGCRMCAVVKADAYGLGATRIARQLEESGADMLAVYSIAQAEAIAQVGVTLPQLVLMPERDMEVGSNAHRMLLAGRLALTIHGSSHAREVADLAERLGGVTIPVHLEIDTGMSRGGAAAEDAARALACISDARYLRLAGVFTHFTDSAGESGLSLRQDAQLEQFLRDHAAELRADTLVHASNSHAALADARLHHGMVRVGLAWTGLAQSRASDGCPIPLEPIVRWESQVVLTKEIEAGASVGYGSRWTAPRRTRLGLVPVGYFDGYPMSPDGRTRSVRVLAETPAGPTAHSVAVVGAVNMDQIVIDLTEVPAVLAYASGFVGMRVEVYGSDPAAANFLPTVAEASGTHSYDLLCRISPRIPRVHVGGSAIDRTIAEPIVSRLSHGAMSA